MQTYIKSADFKPVCEKLIVIYRNSFYLCATFRWPWSSIRVFQKKSACGRNFNKVLFYVRYC